MMKAMIFAAGRGTRLGALTSSRPKALVEIDGVPLLEIVLLRLRAAGVSEVVINVHHHGAQIEAFVAQHAGFGMRVEFSREETLLDTGGGLKKAAAFFARDEARSFLVHNVDVLSDVDLAALVHTHETSGALATLVAMERPTSRPLLFDARGFLCGRVDSSGEHVVRPPEGSLARLGFCGIHAISPALLPRLAEIGAFSIIDSYLRLAAGGETIRAFRADGCRWRDAGRPENLRAL